MTSLDENLETLDNWSSRERQQQGVVSALATYPDQLVVPKLIRAAYRGTDWRIGELRDELKRRGYEADLKAIDEALSSWNRSGLRARLAALDDSTLARIRASYGQSTSSSYWQHEAIRSALQENTPRAFLTCLLDEPFGWEDHLAKWIDNRGAKDVAILIRDHRSTIVVPPSFASARFAAAAVVSAYISHRIDLKRAIALLRVADASSPMSSAEAIRAELTSNHLSPELEELLLPLMAALPAAQFRSSAIYALGSSSENLPKWANTILRAIGEDAICEDMERVRKRLALDRQPDEDLMVAIRRYEDPKTIWTYGREREIPHLLDMASRRVDQAEEARQVLARAGEKALPAVLRRLQGRRLDEETKKACIQIVARMGPPADKSILDLLKTRSTRSLGVEIAKVRGGAWDRSIEALKVLESTSPAVHRTMIDSVLRVSASHLDALLPELMRLFDGSVEASHLSVAQLLRRLSHPRLPALLLESLGGQQLRSRRKNTLLLLSLTHRPGAATLTRCLKSKHPEKRRGACRFLSKVRPTNSDQLALLRARLRDSEASIRRIAARAIGRARDFGSTIALYAASNDRNPAVAHDARAALVQIFGGEMFHPSISSRMAEPAYEWTISWRRGARDPFPKELDTLTKPLSEAVLADETSRTGWLSVLENTSPADIALPWAAASAAASAHRRDLPTAIALWQQVARIASLSEDAESEWRAFHAIGVLHEELGDDAGAWAAFQRASTVIDRAWAALLHESRAKGFYADKALFYDRLVLCALRLGHDAAALEYAEKSKTRYLGDLIARRQRSRRRELALVVREYWDSVDRRRSSQKDSRSSATPMELALIAVNDLQGPSDRRTGFTPKFRAHWERHNQARSSYTLERDQRILEQLWSLTVPDLSAEQKRAFRELHDVFRAALALLRRRSPVGRDDLSEKYVEAARRIAELGSGTNRPFWAFAEYSNWLVEVFELAAEDRVGAKLQLRAFLEPLIFILGRHRVEMVRDRRAVDHDRGLSFRVGLRPASTRRESSSVGSSSAALRSTEWAYVERVLRGEPVRFQSLRQSVQRSPGTAILQFHVTSEGTIAFLVTNLSVEVFTFPKFSLENLNELLASRKDEPDFASGDLLERMYRDLIAPIHPRLRALALSRLLIVPHRGLHLLPIHACCWIENGSPRYLLDEVEITYAPSSTLADICRERRAAHYANTAIAIFETGANDLPYADAERAAILSRACRVSNVSATANAESDLQAMRDIVPLRSCFHFAGHYRHNDSAPLESCLELAQNPHLTLGALFENILPMPRIELAVLSACHTGVIDEKDLADEYIAASGGFMFAGASHVLSALWPLVDVATALLMDVFYQRLLNGESAPAALRCAQRWLRDINISELHAWLSGEDCLIPADVKGDLAARLEGASDQTGRPFAKPLFWAPFIVSAGLP